MHYLQIEQDMIGRLIEGVLFFFARSW